MKHLEDVQMNYTMHLTFAWMLALKLFLLSWTALVHGIFPSIFQVSVSDKINRLSDDFKRDELSRDPH
jgi:hypothetical protein